MADLDDLLMQEAHTQYQSEKFAPEEFEAVSDEYQKTMDENFKVDIEEQSKSDLEGNFDSDSASEMFDLMSDPETLSEEEFEELPLNATVTEEEKEEMAFEMSHTKAAVGGLLDTADSAVKLLTTDLAEFFLRDNMAELGLSEEQISEVAKEVGGPTNLGSLIPKTGDTSEGIVRSITQFVGPFALLGKIQKLKKLQQSGKLGAVASAAIRAPIADFAAFDEQEETLTEMAKQMGFESELTEFFEADPADSAIKARGKRAIEGIFIDAGVGVAFESAWRGMKWVKDSKAIKESLNVFKAKGAVKLDKQTAVKATAQLDKALAGDKKSQKKFFKTDPFKGLDLEEMRVDKKLVSVQAQKTAARALGISTDDALKPEFKKQIEEAGNAYSAITLNQAQVYNDFSDYMQESVLPRMEIGDVKAADEAVGELIGMVQYYAKTLDAQQAIPRAMGLRSQLGELPKVADVNELVTALSTLGNQDKDTMMKSIAKLMSKGDTETTNAFLKQLVQAPKKTWENYVNINRAIGNMVQGAMLFRANSLFKDTVGQAMTVTVDMFERPLAGAAGLIRTLGGLRGNDRVLVMETVDIVQGYFLDSFRDAFTLMAESAQRNADAPTLKAKGVALLKKETRDEIKKSFKAARVKQDSRFLERGSQDSVRTLFGEEFADGPTGKMMSFVVNFAPQIFDTKDGAISIVKNRAEIKALARRQAVMEGVTEPEAFTRRMQELMTDPTLTIPELRKSNAASLSPDQKLDLLAKAAELGPENAVLASKQVKIREKAGQEAIELVLGEDLPKSIELISKAIQHIPLGPVAIPFIKTITNLAKFGIRRSPIAPIMPTVFNQLRAGGAEADLALGRMMFGVGATMYGANLLSDGNYIPSFDLMEQNERDALREAGIPDESLRFIDETTGEVSYVSLKGLDPMFPIKLGATMQYLHAKHNYDVPKDIEKDLADALLSSAAITSSLIVNGTFATNIAELFKVVDVNDPTAAERILSNMMTAPIPGVVSEIQEEIDDAVRTGDGVMQRVAAKLGVGGVEVLDSYGVPRKKADLMGQVLRIRETNFGPEDEWRLKVLELGASPSRFPRRIDGVELTLEEQKQVKENLFQTGIVDLTRDALEDLTLSDIENMQPEEKKLYQDMVKDMYSMSVQEAQMMFKFDNPEFEEKVFTVQEQKDFSARLTPTEDRVLKGVGQPPTFNPGNVPEEQ